jgi:hypothetical protein
MMLDFRHSEDDCDPGVDDNNNSHNDHFVCPYWDDVTSLGLDL